MCKNLYKELTKPFTNEIQFRVGETGYKFNKPYVMLLAYVDSRVIEQRLDDVLGFQNWQDKYIPISYQDKKNVAVSGYICELTLDIEGKKVTKSNSAEMTNFEGLKGGCSKALVRTASRFGIGRHLYDFKNVYATTSDKKNDVCKNYQKVEEKKWNTKNRRYEVINTHNIYWGIDKNKIIKEHLAQLNYTNTNNNDLWKNVKLQKDYSKLIVRKLYNNIKNYDEALKFLKVFGINSIMELDTTKQLDSLYTALHCSKDGIME